MNNGAIIVLVRKEVLNLKKSKYIYRIAAYSLGMLLLAFGIILNTKCGLGVSPIISVAYSFSLASGMKIGNATLGLYSMFVLIELVIHATQKSPKKQYLIDLLQIAVSVVFTRFMNLFSDFVPQLDVQYKGSWQGRLPFRIAMLAVAIVLTGIGAAMSLNMRVVPNPGDGVVQTVADKIKKPVGFTKNCWDLLMVVISAVITVALHSKIAGSVSASVLSVIGIGTVLAVIGVGRVIAVFNKLTYERMTSKAGVNNMLKV